MCKSTCLLQILVSLDLKKKLFKLEQLKIKNNFSKKQKDFTVWIKLRNFTFNDNAPWQDSSQKEKHPEYSE
jgi:hypothetical protein